MILKNGIFLNDGFRFEKGDVSFSENGIEKLGDCGNDGEVYDCTDRYIVPGFVDIHTHGCVGVDASDGASVEDYEKMLCHYAAHGVTTVLPSTETLSPEKTMRAVKALAKAAHSDIKGANIGGIHLEGPYFSYRYRGAQNEAYLRNPDIDEVNRLNEACGYIIRRISVAPELPGALEFIRTLSKNISISLAHTDGNYEQAIAAIDAGADGLTHTFNGMRPLHHREPNVVGAGLERQLFCEFIGDGFHISPTVLRLAFRMLGDTHMLFISDSLRACGMPDGKYDIGELPFIVKDGHARLPDGTIAGSTVTVHDCAVNAISFGLPPESVFRMCSQTPARAVRIDSLCGSITPGKRADLVILKKDYSIDRVILRGKFFNNEEGK